VILLFLIKRATIDSAPIAGKGTTG